MTWREAVVVALVVVGLGIVLVVGEIKTDPETQVFVDAYEDMDCNAEVLAERDCYDFDMTPGTDEWVECMEESITYWEETLGD